ncbi:SusC/RagA family TonB-linked outer membrane protein [Niastella koreensis]|uniref:TonB-dependent receptor plug n=2 Tax=Niastella koreensis TaxID=354356 RepID=G8TM17_NIAKG|nr:TonB-dependent receptor [Niastella koreensis]AEV98777.1 TonB-dependent receptor plug [Niastella koreensis GR20-10]OQP44103.1 SusC/RagA family TonB-linked outer membrane protein [Niastella koreensis]
MKNHNRDNSFRRVCIVLKCLLAITLNLLAVTGATANGKNANDRFSLIITGKITDDKGVPLGEVTIAEKGANNITMSKEDGTFTITVSNEKAVLFISHVGYIGQEIFVKGRKRIEVRLVLASLSMDSTIVVGYGRQKKQSLVGAITQVKGDVLQRAGGVSSLGAALTGNLPGVITVATQGTPGGEDPKIYIRGQSTWNNSDPLILVDGIERPMNSVDIGSVETISVLKDASATAVFGVKGANGVILITTKRGREGKAEIRFTGNATVKAPSKLASKYDAYDAIKVRDQAIERELGISPSSWYSYVPYAELDKYRHPANQAEAERYPNIDWQDQLVKKHVMSYNGSLNISGGSPLVKYFTAVDYLHEGDIIKKIDNGKSYKPGYGFDRVNARTNLDFNLTKSTVLSANLAGSYGVKQDAYGQDSWEYRIWQSIYNNAPDLYYPRYSDGGWGYFPLETVSTINSLAVMGNNGVRKTTTTRITTDFTLRQDLSAILKGLAAKGTLSFDNSFVSQGGIYDNGNIQQEYIDPVTGEKKYSQYLGTNQFDWIPPRWNPNVDAVQDASTYRKLFYQLQVDYARRFGKHDVTAMGMFSRDKYATGSEFEHFREDWVSRVTYNYDGRYFAEFNGAYNGSEKFGPNYRFAFFPSAAAGWMISNEKFMQKHTFLNTLKLRASYGQVGNDNVNGRWLYMTNWTYGGNTPLGSSAGQNSPYNWWAEARTSVGNPDIHWEKVTKANFGLDYALWNGLVAGSVEVFNDYRTDILLAGTSRSVPSYFGVQPATTNVGKVRNKGYEIELRLNKTLSKGVRLWANFAMTHAKDRIIDAEDAQLLDDYQKKAGKSIGQAYSYVSSGFYNTWDQVYGSTKLNTYDNQKLPGNLNMVDYNGDGVIDNKDVVPYGYPERPQNTYNATLGVEWKGFSAFVQFYGVNNINRYLQLVSFSGQYHYDNVYKQGTYWTKDNPNAQVPMPRYASVMPYYGTTYLYDGSYLRLKNAEIAYTFKLSQLKHIGINAFRLYVNGDNLILWTKMPDDREVSMGAATAYPTIRRFNMGCNLTF